MKPAVTDSRSRLMARNIAWSVLVKGWASLVVFLLVPLTLRCLGTYINGLWLTISAVLVWFDQMDIGLGNGLRNQLAEHLARGDVRRAREAVSTVFAMMIAIVVPIAGLMVGLVAWADVHVLFHADPALVPELREVLSAVIVLFCSTFVLRFIGNVYMALQLPAVNNLIVAAGQTLTLLGTAALWWGGAASLMNVALVATASPLIVHLVAYPVTFCWRYPELRPRWKAVRLSAAGRLIGTGIQFFLLQVSGIILFTSSNFLIAQCFTPAMVTPYQIAYRYMTLTLMAFGIVSTPFWSATTDAYTRGDMAWIVRSGRRLGRVVLAFYGLIALMVILSPWFYQVWIGREVEVPMVMTSLLGLYTAVFISSTRYSCFLNGCGKLRLQLIMTLFAAAVFIPVALAAHHFHPVVATLIIVMTCVNVPGLIVNRIQYHRIINCTATGLWNR